MQCHVVLQGSQPCLKRQPNPYTSAVPKHILCHFPASLPEQRGTEVQCKGIVVYLQQCLLKGAYYWPLGLVCVASCVHMAKCPPAVRLTATNRVL